MGGRRGVVLGMESEDRRRENDRERTCEEIKEEEEKKRAGETSLRLWRSWSRSLLTSSVATHDIKGMFCYFSSRVHVTYRSTVSTLANGDVGQVRAFSENQVSAKKLDYTPLQMDSTALCNFVHLKKTTKRNVCLDHCYMQNNLQCFSFCPDSFRVWQRADQRPLWVE